MNHEDQIKLQALLDGELPPDEARTYLSHVQRDPAAAALLAELRATRQSLKSSPGPVIIPESREFYWSKIASEIERQERRAPARPPSRLLAGLRLLILPTAVVIVLVIIGFALHFHAKPGSPVASGTTTPPPAEPKLAGTDTTNTILGR